MNNYGLINVPIHPNDYLSADVEKEALVIIRDWSMFLPKKEIQRTEKYDTYACVTFSALNCIETLLKRKYKAELNLSDRYTAKKSGTIPGVGNYLTRVAQSIRHDGVLEESQYPFGGNTVEEYYQEIPENTPERRKKGLVSLDREAKLFADSLNITYSWIGYDGVSNEDLYEALQYAPVQITVKAWNKPNAQGIYDYVHKGTNHAVMLYKMDKDGNKWVYDHYNQEIKQLSPNFYVGHAMLYTITDKLGMQAFVKLFRKYFGANSYAGKTNTYYWLEYSKTNKLPF